MRLVVGARRDPGAVPWEIQDAVELWARSVGRHARVRYSTAFDPPIPQVVIELKPDDGRLEAWQKGELEEKPVETVDLVEYDEEKRQYVGLNLMELGPSGVTELLEKGNMWSGRGEYDSLQEAIVAAREQQKRDAEAFKQHMRWEALALAEEHSYSEIGVPMVRGADLTKERE